MGAGLEALESSLKSCPSSASRMLISPEHTSRSTSLPQWLHPSNCKPREILLPLGSFVSHGLFAMTTREGPKEIT